MGGWRAYACDALLCGPVRQRHHHRARGDRVAISGPLAGGHRAHHREKPRASDRALGSLPASARGSQPSSTPPGAPTTPSRRWSCTCVSSPGTPPACPTSPPSQKFPLHALRPTCPWGCIGRPRDATMGRAGSTHTASNWRRPRDVVTPAADGYVRTYIIQDPLIIQTALHVIIFYLSNHT